MVQEKVSKNTPYKNWSDKELRHTLIDHIHRLKLESKLTELWIDIVNEAHLSDQWNMIEDYNGCSIVQDMFHPCPACFVHDYMWISGRGGKVSDRIFYHLMIAEGMRKSKAWRRWLAVRVGWIFFYQWKYIIKRKWMNPTKAMLNLNKYFK